MLTYDINMEHLSDSTSTTMLNEVENDEEKDEPEDQGTPQIGSLQKGIGNSEGYTQIHFFYCGTEYISIFP